MSSLIGRRRRLPASFGWQNPFGNTRRRLDMNRWLGIGDRSRYTCQRSQYSRRRRPNAIYRHKTASCNSVGLMEDSFNIPEMNANMVTECRSIVMPSFGTEPGERSSTSIKVWSVQLEGYVVRSVPVSSAESMQTDQSASPLVGVISDNGMGVLYLVIDRQPNQEGKPTFAEIFNHGQGESRTNVFVRASQSHRFCILRRIHIDMPAVNEDGGCETQLRLNRFVHTGRSGIACRFRDTSQLDGSYKNIHSNAILMCLVWECKSGSKLRCHVNMRIKYFY